MPQDYQSQFRAFYDPNLRTEANISLPGVGYGEGSGGGGIDIDSILRTVWGYKQRAAAAEAARQEAAAAAAAERQREALKYQTDLALQTEQQRLANKRRDFNDWRTYVDSMENPLDRYTSGNSNLGSHFRNFVAAGELSGQAKFDNPWIDLYKAAASGPSESAVTQAGKNLRHQQSLAAGVRDPKET